MHDALLWQTAQAQTILANRDVGAAIRLARQHRCWRQADLAAAADYSVSTISRLETSRRAPADLDQIRRECGCRPHSRQYPQRVARRVVPRPDYG